MTSSSRKAVTLVEVLVVLCVISLIVSLTLPAIHYARSRAERLTCQNRLRQLGLAMHSCQATQGLLIPNPNAKTAYPSISGFPGIVIDRVSWLARMLPYIEREDVFNNAINAFSLDTNPFNNPPHSPKVTVIHSYTCSADDRLSVPFEDYRGEVFAYTSFVGIIGFFDSKTKKNNIGVFGMSRQSITHIYDGASNTIMVGERPPVDKPWGGWWYSAAYMDRHCRGPNTTIHLGPIRYSATNCDSCELPSHGIGPGRLDNHCDRFHLWSLHGGGANLLFADASVRFLSYSSNGIIGQLVSVNGGENVQLDE